MTSFDKLAELPLTIDSHELSGQQADVSSGFLRMTTTINFSGGGEVGGGEDVTYDNEDHEALQAWGAPLDLAGEWTLGSFCEALEALDLFPQPPLREISRNYRIWGFESAALDLALRQAGQSLHQRLGLTPKPLRFVCSLRLGEPPAILAPLEQRLSLYPDLEFKLDPTPEWDAATLQAVANSGRAAVLGVVLLAFTMAAFTAQRFWVGTRSYTTVTSRTPEPSAAASCCQEPPRTEMRPASLGVVHRLADAVE